MDLKNLFDYYYWFASPQVAGGATLWIFLVGFLLMIIFGIVLRILVTKQKEKANIKLYKKFSDFGMTMGLLGLIWLFFRQERITFLSWRFWLVVWLLIAVYWKAGILRYMLKRMPMIKQEKEEKQEKEKYLPKKKKK